MSWTSNGFFRNVNILRQLSATSGSQVVPIYQPGTINPLSLSQGARYSGFITSLRVCVDITSIAAVEFPDVEPGMTDGEIQALFAGFSRTAPKKEMDLLLQNSGQPPVKIATMLLYNRRPYYTQDLLMYLTGSAAFDVGSDTVFSLRIVPSTFGLLGPNDRVNIYGSAVEEAENTAPALNITVIGGGGGNSVPPNAVPTTTGQPITTTTGQIVTL